MSRRKRRTARGENSTEGSSHRASPRLHGRNDRAAAYFSPVTSEETDGRRGGAGGARTRRYLAAIGRGDSEQSFCNKTICRQIITALHVQSSRPHRQDKSNKMTKKKERRETEEGKSGSRTTSCGHGVIRRARSRCERAAAIPGDRPKVYGSPRDRSRRGGMRGNETERKQIPKAFSSPALGDVCFTSFPNAARQRVRLSCANVEQ